MLESNDHPPTSPTAPKAASLIQISLLAAAVFLLAMIWHNQTQDKFSYVITSPLDTRLEFELNQLGALGYEVVAARRATVGHGEGSEARYELILKRKGPALDVPK